MFNMEAAKKALEFRNRTVGEGASYDVLLADALYEIERLQRLLSHVVSSNYDEKEKIGTEIEVVKGARQSYLNEAAMWNGKYMLLEKALIKAKKTIDEALIRLGME